MAMVSVSIYLYILIACLLSYFITHLQCITVFLIAGNPWESAPANGFREVFKMLSETNLRKTEQAITPNAKPPFVEKMNWELIREPSQAGENNIVVTWLGQ